MKSVAATLAEPKHPDYTPKGLTDKTIPLDGVQLNGLSRSFQQSQGYTSEAINQTTTLEHQHKAPQPNKTLFQYESLHWDME